MSLSLKVIPLLLISLLLLFLYKSLDSANTTFLPSNDLHLQFELWMSKNNRTYASEEEYTQRFKVFSDNYEYIQAFNANPNRSHDLALNHFADLFPEERQIITKGHKHGSLLDALEPMMVEIDASTLPASVDWRTKNVVTPIKSQGHCGGCWAFSTIAGLEGLFAIKNGTLKTFSEQNLIDCSTNGPNSGCAGGDPPAGYDYIRMVGIEDESEYPFVAVDEKCQKNLSLFHYQIKGYVQVPANDSDQLAAAVAKQPVSICIDGDTPDFLYYTGGIFESPSCTTELGHCLAIVGYGTENGVDYWIVKNSYGTGWGENGYVRMIKQSGTGPGICGITLEAIYPLPL